MKHLFNSSFGLLSVTVTTIFLSSISNAIEIKGFNYTAWDPNAFLTEGSDLSLINAKKIGCNWMAPTAHWFQDDINSTLIEPDYSEHSVTPEAIIHVINKCHEGALFYPYGV